MKKLWKYAEEAAGRYDTDPIIKELIDCHNNLERAINVLGIDGVLSEHEFDSAVMDLNDFLKNVLAASAGCKETRISDVKFPVQETCSESLTKQYITELDGRDRLTSSILENESYVVRVNKSCHERHVMRSNTKFDRWSDIIVMDKEDGRVFRFKLECELVRDQPYFKDERLTLEGNDEVLEMFRDLYKGDGNGGISDKVCERIRNSEESYKDFVTMVLKDEELGKKFGIVGNVVPEIVGNAVPEEDGSDIGKL